MNAGPGSYNPKEPLTASAYTIIGRPKETSAATLGPGPGMYNVNSALKYIYPSVKATIKVGSISSASKTRKTSPGPGTYRPKIAENISGPKYFPPSRKVLKESESEPKIKIKNKPEAFKRGRKVDKFT